MKKLEINTKSFLLKCKRVWHVMKKPSKEEFQMVAKVSAIGILIIGAIGFLILLIMRPFV
jgi:protein transport protein SEC61 subunit gamma-like protein